MPDHFFLGGPHRLAEVENKLVEMQLQFEENEAKEKDLQAQVDACTTKLNRAERLIGGLGGEKSRWQIAVQELNIRQKNVVGDVLVSSGAVAYMGPFTAPYRAELNATWQRRMVEFGWVIRMPCSFVSLLVGPLRAGCFVHQISYEGGIPLVPAVGSLWVVSSHSLTLLCLCV